MRDVGHPKPLCMASRYATVPGAHVACPFRVCHAIGERGLLFFPRGEVSYRFSVFDDEEDEQNEKGDGGEIVNPPIFPFVLVRCLILIRRLILVRHVDIWALPCFLRCTIILDFRLALPR